MSHFDSPITHEELVQLLQEGRIDFLQFVTNSEYSHDYIEWCKSHNVSPDNDSAEFFCDMTEIDMLEHQYINAEYNGVLI
jgi:iron only hydrogenase large subunit-like protein